MSKVLFCFPPLDDGPAIKGGNTSGMYSLGIPYLMSYVEKRGHTTGALIGTYDTWDDWFPKFILIPEVEGIQDPEEVG